MAVEFTPTKNQKEAVDKIFEWSKVLTTVDFRLGGYAGTGKTSILYILRRMFSVSIRFAFCAYTGKASKVLDDKLTMYETKYPNDFIGTIHRLIYMPKMDYKGNIIGWEKRDNIDYDFIIVDEASMVDEKIYSDLLSYGIPTVFIGDKFQLPPISDTFDLMSSVDYVLTEILRQEADNPIIKLSCMLRNYEDIPFNNFGNNVVKVCKRRNQDIVQKFIASTKNFNNTMILCGTNKTRVKVNNIIRKMYNLMDKSVRKGERVICLSNNWNARPPIVNGSTGTVLDVEEFFDHYTLKILFDGEVDSYRGYVNKFVFDKDKCKNIKTTVVKMFPDTNIIEPVSLDIMDFSYCITVHKSQGSQARRVMLIDESYIWDSDKESKYRWLYTAVTRSSNQLLIAG